ncbi:MAG TPA: phosphoribosylformylglycinamidine cyclo-ligase [Candidatus Bathyarchaeia archaeon]|nr:phosphoribosylformylglycinamidine cyclo-ligase [Candidatus Bathyarchaeia archaeon]
MSRPRMTYAKAGVDINKVRAAHRVLARKLETTFRARRGKIGHPIFPIGHYAGLIDMGHGQVLSLHVDSVGTKVIIAQMMRKYDTIGIDCVAMCANDLICTGSEPIAFLDYLALSRPNPALVDEVAEGIVEGAKQAGMAVVGGEMAIVPDLLSEVGIDLVGMATGVCSKEDLVLGDKVRKGDVVIGVASSGIHSNGLTLARKVLLRNHRLRERIPELGRSIGEELLEPTRIYVKPVIELLRRIEVHGLAHITGGAFTKLGRVLSQANLGAALDNSPPMPGIFRLIKKEGRISEREMHRTFNMGVGFIVICPQDEADRVIRLFKKNSQQAFRLGRAERKPGIRVNGVRVN